MDWLQRNYEVIKTLGTGSHGVVYAVNPRSKLLPGIRFGLEACKMTKSTRDCDLQQEAEIMMKLRGIKGVVQLRNIYQGRLHSCLVMEFCRCDLLEALLRNLVPWGEAEAARITLQLAKAIQAIHLKGIVHRDLKLSNVLVKVGRKTQVKIGDFGSAVYCEENEQLSEFVGTSRYMAPEVYRGKYGRQVDVYGLGLILYALVERKDPFGNISCKLKMREAIRGEEISRKYLSFTAASDYAENLILKMTRDNPRKRMSIEQVLRDPWLCFMSKYL